MSCSALNTLSNLYPGYRKITEANRQGLLEFLNWVGEKGMIKKTTARSLRVACNAVIGVLDEVEAGDLSKVDLPAIFRRYENLNSMVAKPATMKVYRRRVNYAV